MCTFIILHFKRCLCCLCVREKILFHLMKYQRCRDDCRMHCYHCSLSFYFTTNFFVRNLSLWFVFNRKKNVIFNRHTQRQVFLFNFFFSSICFIHSFVYSMRNTVVTYWPPLHIRINVTSLTRRKANSERRTFILVAFYNHTNRK